MRRILMGLVILLLTIVLLQIFMGGEEIQTPQEEFINETISYDEKNFENIEEYNIAKDYQSLVSNKKEELRNEYEKGSYTLSTPYINVDPYGFNNLSAYVAFDTDSPVKLSYEVIAKDGGIPFEYTSDKYFAGTVVIPVVGLYQNYDNQVKLSVEYEDGSQEWNIIKIKTESSPSNYDLDGFYSTEVWEEEGINVDSSIPTTIYTDATLETQIYDDTVLEYFENGFIMTEENDVYDIEGELRFSSPEKERNQSLKFYDGQFIKIVAEEKIAVRTNLMGEINAVYYIPVTTEDNVYVLFHNDSVISPDGKYVYMLAGIMYDKEYTSNDGKSIIDSDGYMKESLVFKYPIEGGFPVDVFDYSDDFKSDEANVNEDVDYDSLHLNSIDYYEDKDQLIISSKSQSSIFGVDAKSGELQWIIPNLNNSIVESDKILDVVNPKEFIYTSGNHTAFIMNTEKYDSNEEQLYLSVFNNNNCADENKDLVFTLGGSLDNALCTPEVTQYSSMIIYEINLRDFTVEFKEEIIPDNQRWSPTRSSVFTNNKGIYEINYSDKIEGNIAIGYSDLYIVNEEEEVLAKVMMNGFGNVSRSRILTKDMVYDSINNSISNFNNKVGE